MRTSNGANQGNPVAPLGTADLPIPWEGRSQPRPWEHEITASVPHMRTLDTLPLVIGLLERQSLRPFIVVVDTGSPLEDVAQLEALRSPTTEIHYIRSHGYRHSSAPVTTALDVTAALCRTPYLFLTHTDVFPVSRDLLRTLHSLCHAEQPVVGYEMSPREGTQKWRNVVSHTCTMLHMPTIRRIGATWSFERYWEGGGQVGSGNGYPDTEQPFDSCIRAAGVYPHLIGHDKNFERQTDGLIDHARSLAGIRMYAAGSSHQQRSEKDGAAAIADARARIAQWDAEDRRA